TASQSAAARQHAAAQDAAAEQATARAPDVAQPGPASELPRTGKRASADGGILGWVGDRIHDAENWAEDKIEGAVMSVAPGLATLIKEGPGGLLKNAIQPAIQSWVGTVTGGVDIGEIAGQLKQSFSSAFAVLQGAKTGDARCCETLVNGINAIREVAHAFMNNPVMDAIKSVFTKVSDIVNTVTKLVIGPAFEVLKTLVGGAWDAIGETIGYLVGMIAFQALLDYLSAGTWTGAMAVISGIAKFLNWPMAFLGEAMGLLKKLGGFILDGLKSLGKMAADAAAGALHEVLGAFREIGTKLGEFADELLSKFGGKTAENDAAHTLENDAARTAENDAARDAGAAKDGKPGDGDGKPGDGAADSAATKEAQKAAELPQAIAISRSIATAEDVGGVPGPAIAVSLDALKARYSWIKAYEAVPNAAGFEIFLIASKFSIIQAHNRMAQLPMDVQIQFSGLSDEAITKFAALDDAALTRFATLDETALIKFGELDEAALAKFGQLSEAELAKFAKLDRTALENFGALRELNMLQAYGQLSDEALAKFAKLDRGTLEKFAGWAHDNPRPILQNIALQNDETIDLLSKLKVQPESKAINASAPFETRQIRAPGMTYQIDRGTISHVLERHHPDFWIGEVKQIQSFLPRSLTPADLSDVIMDVFNQNRDKILARGAGTFQVEGVSHGFRWTVGFKNGRIGQLYPIF
ncbi:MAG TPA: hypothetical protein VF516_38965, partial [Kofleriaceae bacterium]